MINEEVKLLNGNYTVLAPTPSTMEELVALLGSLDAVMDEAIANLRYRNYNARIYGKGSDAIKDEFPKAEKSREKREGKDDKVVYEADMDHLRRFIEGNEVNNAALKVVFDKLAATEPLYVKGERSASAGKISDAAKESSKTFFAAGPDTVKKIVGQIEANYPGYKIVVDAEGMPSEEGLARGIQSLNKYIKAKNEEIAKAQTAGILSM